MKSFKDYLNEGIDVPEDVEIFMENIKQNFYKYFPNGYITINYSKSLTEHISCAFGIIGNLNDVYNRIRENDPTRHTFLLFKKDGDSWEFKTSFAKVYMKPDENHKHYVMQGKKTGLRNASNITLDKTEDKMDKFFKKYAKFIKDNRFFIHREDEIKEKYFDIRI